ncbi:MAG: alpha/beta hydrolase [Fluviicola sp.]|jgi:pimeloyl-ACP methyl ester carboxylesterase|uniref:alpha/beta fold hydrolase n=1 Tax=Fluviicola sp. TaxID=1917219 RepID=UPI00263200DB|nr:alpha/beta hydrolase [Fluviicola sp.]MDF3026007.1 alpha/beta hydrolase [Fluviicola sp.]
MANITSKDGTLIAFEQTGKGSPIIIVNGALTDRNGGKSLAAELSEHFTVFIYDRRGRGESTDVQPYAVEREIEDIEALIRYAGGSACLFGGSSGGALSLQAASKLGPSMITKIALYETPYGQQKQDFDKQKKEITELVKTGKPGDAAVYFLSQIGTPPEALEEMKNSPQWETIKKIDFTLVYDYLVLGDGAIPQTKVKNISVPVLVMDGEHAADFIRASADELAHLIPDAKRKILKGQTHQADNEVLVPVLVEFFS